MNRTTKRAKPIKLELKRDTVATLTGDMLKQVAGGMIPLTKHSACASACTDC